ncbi:MAG: helix-turn-helix transcriptional regulator [Chloroflexi bacterium]|nr:helix-turn-helix transcriptional regulator [Chloroflexota bacterium]
MRRLRHGRGITQEALADLAELDRTFISMLERGKRRATLESAEAIARAFGLTITELIQAMDGQSADNVSKSDG